MCQQNHKGTNPQGHAFDKVKKAGYVLREDELFFASHTRHFESEQNKE
jgi:hypothetical protein